MQQPKMSLPVKLSIKSPRVKGISFHPDRPWVITSLHSGSIHIWDYKAQVLIAQFEEDQGPIRSVHFHPHLPLFVSGSDSGNVKVWNYKQKRCLYTLKGHIDYIRTTYFHNELPWILSASDDQTMRIWNYQSRNCLNLIAGHHHYVMCAQFHHKKNSNLIVSASLDATVRLWDYSILRKKVGEGTRTGFIGVEIQCVKLFLGHTNGANWACFHPTLNLIASGSDDKKIRIWKNYEETTYESTSIPAHKRNVSCVMFDPLTQNLISNSQDNTLKIWDLYSKQLIIQQNIQKSRFWMMAIDSKNELLAAGHDQGLEIYQLHRDKIVHAALRQTILITINKNFLQLNNAKNSVHKKQQINSKKRQKMPVISFYDKIVTNQFDDSLFLVFGNQNQNKLRCIYLRQINYNETKSSEFWFFSGIDACFISKNQLLLVQNQKTVAIYNVDAQIKDKTTFSSKSQIKRVFKSIDQGKVFMVFQKQYEIQKASLREPDCSVQKYKLQTNQVYDVLQSYGKILILMKDSFVVLSQDFKMLFKIKQKHQIYSTIFDTPQIILYSTASHLKYTIDGQIMGVLKNIQEPLYFLTKNERKLLTFSKTSKAYNFRYYQFKYFGIQLEKAIKNKEINAIKAAFSDGETQKKIWLKRLVENGLPEIAAGITNNTQQRFFLAIQSSNFQMAYQICNKVNSQQYWKLLGQEALKQGIYQAFQLSCQKLKDFEQLNFLYSLQGNKQKLQKMVKIGKKMNNNILCFNANLYINNGEIYEQILRQSGYDSLAQLCKDAHSGQKNNNMLNRLNSKPLQPACPIGTQSYSNWPHNIAQ